MARVDDALLLRMTAIIVEAVDPEQVILFGSCARGNAEADSDVDLVIVEAEPFGPDRDRGAEETRLWRALAKFHVPKDILVYSLDEADRWRGSLNHVLARAARRQGALSATLSKRGSLWVRRRRTFQHFAAWEMPRSSQTRCSAFMSNKLRRSCSKPGSLRRAGPTHSRHTPKLRKTTAAWS